MLELVTVCPKIYISIILLSIMYFELICIMTLAVHMYLLPHSLPHSYNSESITS